MTGSCWRSPTSTRTGGLTCWPVASSAVEATCRPSPPRCTSRSSTSGPDSAWTCRRSRSRRIRCDVATAWWRSSLIDGPLAGFTVAITADRRRDEFAALLERRGARVVLAPALRIVPIADDVELFARTTDLVRRPPTVAFISTGIGLRGWLEAAEGWGVADGLLAALGTGYLIARGAKAR